MKRLLFVFAFLLASFAVAVSISLVSLASPHFVTPSMTDRRNGLTDAQYEFLWSIGKNPAVSQNAARDWAFRASRYQNVTNWLDICGATNDFAALSYELQDENFHLEETNAVLVATNSALTAQCVYLATEALRLYEVTTNQLAHISSLSNMLVIVSAQADAANAKIQDEIADLNAKIATYESYKTKYPLLKAVWNALIADAENRIKILQALTGTAK